MEVDLLIPHGSVRLECFKVLVIMSMHSSLLGAAEEVMICMHSNTLGYCGNTVTV